MEFVVGDRLSNIIRRPKAQSLQKVELDTPAGQSGLKSELYFVSCIREYWPTFACAKHPREQEVTLVQMSFSTCDIWIALPGAEVAFGEVN